MPTSRANAAASFQAALKDIEQLFDAACEISGCTDLEAYNPPIAPGLEADGAWDPRVVAKRDRDEPHQA
jgi:hypothetical protein